MELEDHNEETEDRAVEFLAPAKKIFEIIVPILTLMTIVNCVIILVLVMNIGRKVNRLEQQMIILQNNAAVSVSNMSEESRLPEEQADVAEDVADIDGSWVTDQTEAADIVEAAVLEDTHKWDGREDSSAGIRRVYLTFDDGPSANTDRILDILNQYGVKATFFVVAKDGYRSVSADRRRWTYTGDALL